MDVKPHTKVFPTAAQLDRGEFDLTEIFDRDQMDAIMKVAWRRIVRAFIRATEKRNTKTVSTDNYIVMREDNSFESLAIKIIISRGFRNFVCSDDLIPWVDHEDPFCDQIVRQVEYKFVCLVLLSMKSTGDIWYDYGREAWQVAQSNVDQYNCHHPSSRLFKFKRKRNKTDRRTYHGRVRSRTTVAASISFSTGSPVLASM